MTNAKFIGRYFHYEYGEPIIDLEYEYRGYKYTVHKNLNKGNEPLAWQHKSEQSRIDRIIEIERNENKRSNNDNSSAMTVDEVMKWFIHEVEDI